jgi:hypothetical protein
VEIEGRSLKKAHQKDIPMGTVYDSLKRQLYVQIKFDVRVYSIENGRCIRIVRAIEEDGDDEITAFRSLYNIYIYNLYSPLETRTLRHRHLEWKDTHTG